MARPATSLTSGILVGTTARRYNRCMRPEVRRLLKQADRDLENAQRISSIRAYEVAAYPDAANAVPYELYDETTTQVTLRNAQEVVAWLRRRIAD
jgi:HEPN domain-containing protein